MNSKQPAGATHLMTGDNISDPWRDLSGLTWRWADARGVWRDTGESSQAFIERNAYRLLDVASERDSSVADAALWLHMNRSAGRETWLRKTSGDTLVRIARGAQENDERQANDPLAIIRRLSEGDRENDYSEAECFVGEHLIQLGAEHLDDDANVYGVTLYQVVRLLTDYQAPAFTDDAPPTIDLDASAWQSIKEAASQSPWMPSEYMMSEWVSDVCGFLRAPAALPGASPITMTCTVEMSEELRAAFATIQALEPGELVVATPGVGALVPQPSTTLLRECVELLSMYDAGGGSREGLAVEELRTLIAARPAPQPPTSR